MHAQQSIACVQAVFCSKWAEGNASWSWLGKRGSDEKLCVSFE
jgi:hypothetical protein